MKKLIMAGLLLAPTLLAAQGLPDEEARGRYGGGTDARISSPSDSNRLLADIRAAVTSDSSLSVYGRNINITTEDGKTVTLRGPVKSQEEKMRLEQIARAHASSVVNQLEVAKESGGEE